MAENKEHDAHGDAAHGGGGHDDHGGGGHKGGHGGHGGGHEEHEEGVPEWVVSFADNALLQMGFFAILLAMNMGLKATGPVDPADTKPGAASAGSDSWLDMAIEIRSAFNNPVSINSTDPNDELLVKRLKDRAKATPHLGQNGRGNDDKPASNAIDPNAVISENVTINFEMNSAVITGKAREDIAAFASAVKGQRFVIEVMGHVSSFEAKTRVEGQSAIDVGHRLAFERAMAVTKVLVEEGIEMKFIRVRSSADAESIRPGTAPDEPKRRGNQRVELIKTDKPIPPDNLTLDPAER
ncbi:MAG: OmpA family protein [Phycisphaerales bacterium]|nr:OmpA family protein [Phycisphaerales bacterium]